MSFDPEEVYHLRLRGLIEMAEAGHKEYAWHQAKLLNQHETGLWRGIHIALVNHFKQKDQPKDET